MATTATSTQSQVKVGNADTKIQSVVKDAGKDASGNRQFTTEVQRVDSAGKATTIASIDASGKVTPSASATADEKTALGDPNSQLRQGVSKQINDPKVQNTLGVSTEQDKKALAGASGSASASNSGTTPGADEQAGTTLSKEQAAALGEENKFKEGTRTSYSEKMVYPLDLKSEVQDVIRFSILEYSPSLSKENQAQVSDGQFGSNKSRVVTLEGGNPIIKGSKRIGVITLPIPAGISDGNTVSWQNDELTQLQQSAANVARGFLGEGIEGATAAASNEVDKAKAAAGSGDLQSAITSLFIKQAIQGGNVQGRTFGAAFNNNLELLFSGPSLRTFGFTFMFYPREEAEAKMVRQIIRAFKQAMSVKRSKTSLLLKSPHTFAIQYMTAGQKSHPYLNSFKECALTSCSVDYTPDNTYMTYGGTEKSMTSYRLSLSFQELEPLFDDEYDQIDKNKDTFIGF
jgi:hypothetical protein